MGLINRITGSVNKGRKGKFSMLTISVLAFLMFLNLKEFVFDFSGGVSLSSAVFFIFMFSVYFLMIFTGRTSFYRRIFFVAFAVMFVPSFMEGLIQSRGAFTLSESEVVNSEVPFCHIVIPFTLIPAVLSKTIIFPARLTGHYAAVYSMLGIWLAATLVFGRGWCSWVCFYGGWDEGFSRLGRKAGKQMINLDKADPRIKNFSYSMLVFLVLVSLVTVSSVYCEWFCPFKAVTEFAEVTNIASYLAVILFILLFAGLVVVMPVLTRKRVQCGLFCPFGAFQSLVDRISLYRVRIDRKKCIKCMACVAACPTLSLDEELIKSDRDTVGIKCTKCGECIEACRQDAIFYDYRSRVPVKVREKFSSWKKTLEKRNRFASKTALYFLRSAGELLSPSALLPFTAFTFGMIISSGFFTSSLRLIFSLFSGASS